MPRANFSSIWNLEIFSLISSNSMNPQLFQSFFSGKFEVRNLLSGLFVAISFLCTKRHAAMRWHLGCCWKHCHPNTWNCLWICWTFSEKYIKSLKITWVSVHLSSSPGLIALQVNITMAFPTSFSCARIQTIPRGSHLWIRCIAVL